MSNSPDARLVRAFIAEAWNCRDGDERAAAFLHPEYRDHAYGGGAGGLLSALRELRAAFPNAQFRIEALIAEGDQVAARLTMEGRHDGAFRGHEATGRAVKVKVHRWYRISRGKIIEHWALFDTPALLRQIAPPSQVAA